MVVAKALLKSRAMVIALASLARATRTAAALTSHPPGTAKPGLLRASTASTIACLCWWKRKRAPHASCTSPSGMAMAHPGLQFHALACRLLQHNASEGGELRAQLCGDLVVDDGVEDAGDVGPGGAAWWQLVAHLLEVVEGPPAEPAAAPRLRGDEESCNVLPTGVFCTTVVEPSGSERAGAPAAGNGNMSRMMAIVASPSSLPMSRATFPVMVCVALAGLPSLMAQRILSSVHSKASAPSLGASWSPRQPAVCVSSDRKTLAPLASQRCVPIRGGAE